MMSGGACLVLLALAADAAGPPNAANTANTANAAAAEELAFWRGAEVSLRAEVALPPARLAALLAEPATYQRAVPAFVRADVLATRAAAAGPPARLVAWELEVPLWNLAGKLWIEPRADGVRLALAEGDLAPGRFDLIARPAGTGSLLELSGSARLDQANWMTRRLAARDQLAGPAMNLTAMYVLLRALVLEAERQAGRTSPRRQPTAKMAAPAPWAAGDPALLALAGTAEVARVASRADGRLARVSMLVPVALSPALAAARIREADRWRALPGWKTIAARADGAGLRWEVDGAIPFVDFDATWALRAGERTLAGEARAGDWAGAAIAVEVLPRAGRADAWLLLTSHPRIDLTGYVPRKLIEAEPLLEQGLALGLTFVNAHALARALVKAPPPPAKRTNAHRFQ